jgi:hypothetical protein
MKQSLFRTTGNCSVAPKLRIVIKRISWPDDCRFIDRDPITPGIYPYASGSPGQV